MLIGKGLSAGSKPRDRGLPVRALPREAQHPEGKTVCGPFRCGDAVDTRREEKAPKGESQERCRREIKPARLSREKTVKRVAKPRRRLIAGR
jgi:hypothetical protein